MGFAHTAKYHYKYSKEEIKHFVILSLLLGFFFSFNEWGTDTFDVIQGLGNLILGIIIAGLGIFIHDLGQRLMALHTKHKLEAKIWWTGLGVTALICVVSRGLFNLFFAKTFEVEILKRERFGTAYYRTALSEIRNIALMGAVFSLFLATLMKIIMQLGDITGGILHKVILFNVIFAIVHLLPIPPLDGSKIIFDSRWFYCACFVLCAVYGYLLLTPVSIFLSLILALILGIIVGVYMFGK